MWDWSSVTRYFSTKSQILDIKVLDFRGLWNQHRVRCLHKQNLSGMFWLISFFQVLIPLSLQMAHLFWVTRSPSWERPALCTPRCLQRLPSGEVFHRPAKPCLQPGEWDHALHLSSPVLHWPSTKANNAETGTRPKTLGPRKAGSTVWVAESSLLAKPVQRPKHTQVIAEITQAALPARRPTPPQLLVPESL